MEVGLIMNLSHLLSIVDRFSEKSVLVIGDLMVDEYMRTTAHGISREAPIVILKIDSKDFVLGGAGNTVNNVHSMGGKVTPASVIGIDANGEWIMESLKKRGIDVSLISHIDTKPTITKTRVVVKQHQKIRLDLEDRQPIDTALSNRIASKIVKRLPEFDAVIFSDYEKGFVTPTIISIVTEKANELGIPIVVDSQEKHFMDYIGATMLKLSLRHAERVVGARHFNETIIRNTGFNLMNQLNAKSILLTQAEEGMELFEEDQKISHFPQPFKSDLIDITGVRDILSAALGLSLACGASFREATAISNFAVGAKNAKYGTVSITKAELKEYMQSYKEYLTSITETQV
jgi:D-beta-D-heptose 7-phosphate kinase/D-beta-D-heptose 1-phosphate adenosyltransferase